MPRKSLLAEFAPKAPLKKIVPLRAPRMETAYDSLPPLTRELFRVMEELRRLIETNANDGSVEIALGRLRGTLAYVRAKRKFNAANVERAHKAKSHQLAKEFCRASKENSHGQLQHRLVD